MKTSFPIGMRNSALLISLLLAARMEGAPPTDAPVRESKFGERVIQFFRGIGEPDESRARRRGVAVAVPENDPAANVDQPPRRTSESGTVGGGTTTKKKPVRNSSSERSRDSNSSASSTNDDHDPPSGSKVEATKQQLAELKRKVAAMEEELARANGGGASVSPSGTTSASSSTATKTGQGKTPEEQELILTAPAPKVPPRPVAPNTAAVAHDSKRSFATDTQVTPSVPHPGGNASAATAKGGDKGKAATQRGNGNAPVTSNEVSEDVPVAEKTDKPGLVKSPHPPHKEIDVSGLPSGSLAKDPISQKVFRVP